MEEDRIQVEQEVGRGIEYEDLLYERDSGAALLLLGSILDGRPHWPRVKGGRCAGRHGGDRTWAWAD